MFSRWNHGVFASFLSLKVEESETFLKFQEVKPWELSQIFVSSFESVKKC